MEDTFSSGFCFQNFVSHFNFLGVIRDVTAMRSSLATGKLTENEAKDHRQKVVSKTDFLNQRLELDLVVRDSNGYILPPGRCHF